MFCKGLKGIMLGILVVGVAGCASHWGKDDDKHGRHAHSQGAHDYYSASTEGVGDSRTFDGSDVYYGEENNWRDGEYAFAENSTYHFGFDRFDIDESDYRMINAQADYLVKHPNASVRIEGHTDERGSREYNVALGERRAKAVSNILLSQGVSSRQIHVVSYGQEKPASFGHDESSWRLNRRAIIAYEQS